MFRVTGLCAGISPVTFEVPAQRASNAEMFPFDDVIMGGLNRALHDTITCIFSNINSISAISLWMCNEHSQTLNEFLTRYN